MSDRSNLDELIGDLRATLLKIERVAAFYDTFKTDVADLPKGKPYDLIVLADIFTDAYTCIETGFVRVSRFFENNLDRDRWHSHLIGSSMSCCGRGIGFYDRSISARRQISEYRPEHGKSITRYRPVSRLPRRLWIPH